MLAQCVIARSLYYTYMNNCVKYALTNCAAFCGIYTHAQTRTHTIRQQHQQQSCSRASNEEERKEKNNSYGTNSK